MSTVLDTRSAGLLLTRSCSLFLHSAGTVSASPPSPEGIAFCFQRSDPFLRRPAIDPAAVKVDYENAAQLLGPKHIVQSHQILMHHSAQTKLLLRPRNVSTQVRAGVDRVEFLARPANEQHMLDPPGAVEKVDVCHIDSPKEHRNRRSLHPLEDPVNLHLPRDLLPDPRRCALSEDGVPVRRTCNLERRSIGSAAAHGPAVVVRVPIKLPL